MQKEYPFQVNHHIVTEACATKTCTCLHEWPSLDLCVITILSACEKRMSSELGIPATTSPHGRVDVQPGIYLLCPEVADEPYRARHTV